MSKKISLPIIPLKDIVVFPRLVVPLIISRFKSLKALEAATKDEDSENLIILATQKSSTLMHPQFEDIYDIGIVAKIIQIIKLPGENAKVLVEGLRKVQITSLVNKSNYLSAKCQYIEEDDVTNIAYLQDLCTLLTNKFSDYAKVNKKITTELDNAIASQKEPEILLNLVASIINVPIEEKQKILELSSINDKAEFLLKTLNQENVNLETENVIQSKLEQQIKKSQRDYYLNEQIKIIQKELGDDDKLDLANYEKKIANLKLSKEALEKVTAELKKLKIMNPMSSENGVIRNYLDHVLDMPWGKMSLAKIDIKKAAAILDRDHYGMEDVKTRILEYLSALERSNNLKGPILCLIGPPGVGKTSLVKSIAEATGRVYTKFSLGGVRDESEIRGHRRTYLGSMPGKLVTLLKKAKTDNPAMLLDEIDKMSKDFRGDPSSAMLEVLDPEQNSHFVDHYLEIEYNLSNVLFVATANSYEIPRALLDRLEIIKVSGYLEEEKLAIAKNYLLPKILKNHGIKPKEILIEDSTLLDLIRHYTKESGVRSLEREISSLVRKSLKIILETKVKNITILPESLDDYLGVKKYQYQSSEEEEDTVGTTTGLAYTEYGGDLLSIEAVSIPGKGEIRSTGKLGEVMKESTQTAYSFFKSRIESFNVTIENYKDKDIHLHVPEGATPKDGPSAGIAIYTSIVSLMTNNPVKHNVAMTGEITLRGRVLPIGGLREKLLAAQRGKIHTVIIPNENVKDLKKIPDSIKNDLVIIPVKYADEVLKIALANSL